LGKIFGRGRTHDRTAQQSTHSINACSPTSLAEQHIGQAREPARNSGQDRSTVPAQIILYSPYDRSFLTSVRISIWLFGPRTVSPASNHSLIFSVAFILLSPWQFGMSVHYVESKLFFWVTGTPFVMGRNYC
jgi:hypothetical protein